MKTKKLKLNVRLLRKVQKYILSEPLRIDMGTWEGKGNDIPVLITPPCKTTHCIAGSALFLDNPRCRLRNTSNISVATRAAKLLGIEYEYSGSCWSDWQDGYNEANEAIRLFSLGSWPEPFASKYDALQEEIDNAVSCSEERRAKWLKIRQAKLTVKRIDYFIKHRQ